MNQLIKIRTENKIKENQEVQRHNFTMNQREYCVFPNVFSPAIFLGTQWLTKSLIKHCPQNVDVLEIGVGCGCTIVEMLLSKKFKSVSGVDINPQAVNNTKQNLSKHNLTAKIFVSDVLSSPELNFPFQVVYWNYPFHPSNQDWNSLSYIEKSVMDPNYAHLINLLQQSKTRKISKIFLGFSLTMGNYQQLSQIVKDHKMSLQIIEKMDQQKGTICLIKITTNQQN